MPSSPRNMTLRRSSSVFLPPALPSILAAIVLPLAFLNDMIFTPRLEAYVSRKASGVMVGHFVDEMRNPNFLGARLSTCGHGPWQDAAFPVIDYQGDSNALKVFGTARVVIERSGCPTAVVATAKLVGTRLSWGLGSRGSVQVASYDVSLEDPESP